MKTGCICTYMWIGAYEHTSNVFSESIHFFHCFLFQILYFSLFFSNIVLFILRIYIWSFLNNFFVDICFLVRNHFLTSLHMALLNMFKIADLKSLSKNSSVWSSSGSVSMFPEYGATLGCFFLHVG